VWIVIALLSMAIGNFVAIVQTNIKRLLAYSSLAVWVFVSLCLCHDHRSVGLFGLVNLVIC